MIKDVNIICAGHPDPNMKLEVEKGVTVIDNYTRSKTFPKEIYEKYYKNYYLQDNEGVVYPYFPTSGLLAIFHYLSLYDQINISGFTFYDKSQKRHYYDTEQKLQSYIEDAQIEKIIVEKLIDEKKVVLF